MPQSFRRPHVPLVATQCPAGPGSRRSPGRRLERSVHGIRASFPALSFRFPRESGAQESRWPSICPGGPQRSDLSAGTMFGSFKRTAPAMPQSFRRLHVPLVATQCPAGPGSRRSPGRRLERSVHGIRASIPTFSLRFPRESGGPGVAVAQYLPRRTEPPRLFRSLYHLRGWSDEA